MEVIEVDHVPVSLMPPQADLPPGPTLQCSVCKTRLRPGQPHTALEPYPHQTLLAMGITVER